MEKLTRRRDNIFGEIYIERKEKRKAKKNEAKVMAADCNCGTTRTDCSYIRCLDVLLNSCPSRIAFIAQRNLKRRCAGRRSQAKSRS